MIALLMDVTHTSSIGESFRTSVKYDNFLRQGRSMIAGYLATVKSAAPIASTVLRVRYVEYEDGSTAADMDEAVAREQFLSMRMAVRDYARRYADILRSRGRAIVVKLLGSETPSSLETRIAVEQIEVNVASLPEDAPLLERLERLAQ